MASNDTLNSDELDAFTTRIVESVSAKLGVNSDFKAVMDMHVKNLTTLSAQQASSIEKSLRNSVKDSIETLAARQNAFEKKMEETLAEVMNRLDDRDDNISDTHCLQRLNYNTPSVPRVPPSLTNNKINKSMQQCGNKTLEVNVDTTSENIPIKHNLSKIKEIVHTARSILGIGPISRLDVNNAEVEDI